MKSQTLYDKDFNLWIETTLTQIKERNFESVDWENVLEELESLGKQQKRELENRLIILLEHLLKLTYWEVEKNHNERGWLGTIVEQRKQILKLIKNNPSLKPFLNEVYENCYTDARDLAIVKTGLDQEIFPIQPILTLEELLNESFSIH
ncbi:protein of unknown function DUF29 [Gloeothece citriformis PCC 7424]|uniref:DUF29 domain-containing protein n=1 Tax=Gloeothece citriformis (strain PCC 7424) TaxID=65393 RepID=B7KLA5_GLOC7|nr:DUF29 domain-containing protein [Gloeothece citriformis]ACK72477.1 protein of unknown function DUF29 [Gloeothece citriformis PCC 7424]